jgi:hypothetical protein
MTQQPQQHAPTADQQPEWEVTVELRTPIRRRLPAERYPHRPGDHDLYTTVLTSLARRPEGLRSRTPEGELILGCDAQVARIWVRDPEGRERKVDPASIMGRRSLTLGWETLDTFRAREHAGEGRIEPRAERSALTGAPTGTVLWVWRPAA